LCPFTERAVPPIEIKYNAEGDLLFSCSKDHVINAWYSHSRARGGEKGNDEKAVHSRVRARSCPDSMMGRMILITERAVPPIEIKYNAEGDLLFSCSKDHVINAW
jgi:hypothetical protein